MKTGFQAVKLASAAFIVPYIFAMDPSLIMVKEVVGTTVTFIPFISAIPLILSAVLGIVCLAGAVEGYLVDNCRFYERLLLAVAALLLLKPGLLTDGFGLVVLVGIYILQKNRVKHLNLVS